MATVLSASAPPNNLRPLNVLRDLPHVADLIELCFGGTLDTEGHRYVEQMRHSGMDARFVNWAQRMADTVSMPLTGYVWEEDGQIVGNVSLVPFRKDGYNVQLIANVAVHPEYRRRGIARALTQAAMQLAQQKHAKDIWLHVRDDNPGAIALYEQLGFVERLRRSEWRRSSWDAEEPVPFQFQIRRDASKNWHVQRQWLHRLYPASLNWYQLSWNILRPGLFAALGRAFSEYSIRHWAAFGDGRLQATLAVLERNSSYWLWGAFPAQDNGEALTALLIHARRQSSAYRTFILDFPADVGVQAIQAAGFSLRRTLVWMQARPFSS
jgi:GNAT superfamily N-acetyltransferase